MQEVITIKTIAKEVGLSLSAVSKSLNNYPDISEKTRMMVVNKALELGYSPNLIARSLVTNTSNSIGVIVRDSSSIYGELFKQLSAEAMKKNLILIMADSNRDQDLEKLYIQQMLGARVKALIIAPVSNDISSIKRMTDSITPVVYLGGMVKDINENFVCIDVEQQSKISLEYLYGLGHRHIAFIGCNRSSTSYNIRKRMYESEMEKRDLEPLTYIDFEGRKQIDCGYFFATKLIKERKNITAIYCATDLIGIGAIKAINENKMHIPDDISIIGNDGIDVSAMPMINLTSVVLPREEVASNLIRIAQSQADNLHTEQREHFLARPILVERASCRRINIST